MCFVFGNVKLSKHQVCLCEPDAKLYSVCASRELSARFLRATFSVRATKVGAAVIGKGLQAGAGNSINRLPQLLLQSRTIEQTFLMS